MTCHFSQISPKDLKPCTWMMDIPFKLWEKICRPVQMSLKLQSSTLRVLLKDPAMLFTRVDNLALSIHIWGSPGSSSRPVLFGRYKWKFVPFWKLYIQKWPRRMRRDPPSFQRLGQIYLNVSENTASVHYVLLKVKDIFNDPSVELWLDMVWR